MAAPKKRNKPLFYVICLVLIASLLMASVSLARYVSASNKEGQSGVAAIDCTVSVTPGVQSFCNAAFWVSTGNGSSDGAEDSSESNAVKVQMNYYNLSNVKLENLTGGTGQPYEYALIFYIPKTLAVNSAFQILDGSGKDVSGLLTFSEENGRVTASPAKEGFGEVTEAAEGRDGKQVRDDTQVGCDVTALSAVTTHVYSVKTRNETPEGDVPGDYLTSLYLKKERQTEFVRVTVSNANYFVLADGASVSYQLNFVPINSIGELNSSWQDLIEEGDILQASGGYKMCVYSDTSNSDTSDSNTSDSDNYEETITVTAVTAENKNSNKISLSYSPTTAEEEGNEAVKFEDVYVLSNHSCTYPCRVNAVFTQKQSA